MRLADASLATLAAARLSRLLITDKIGQWWVRDPVDAAMDRYAVRETEAAAAEHRPVVEPWWWKYRMGLECGYCAGFWLGVLVLAGYVILPRPLWRFTMGALAMNYVAAHLGSRLGDFDTDDQEIDQ